MFGNGQTVVKGGWGRFDHRRLIDPEVLGANKNVQTEQRWTWHDTNNNKLWDAGEVLLDPNGLDYVSTTGFSNLIPNANELQPKQDEFTLSLEHELMAELRVADQRHLLARPQRLPVAEHFPGRTAPSTFRSRTSTRVPTARLNTADDTGQSFTYYEYSRSVQGAKFNETQAGQRPEGHLVQECRSRGDQAALPALADRGLLLGRPRSTSTTSRCCPTTTRTRDFNTSDNNVEWISKVSGSYNFPYGVLASAIYESRSGDVWARNVLFSGGATIPTLAVNVEPIGTRQYPTSSATSMCGLEKQLQAPQHSRAGRQDERLQPPERQHRVGRDDAVGRDVWEADVDSSSSGRGQRVVQVLACLRPGEGLGPL